MAQSSADGGKSSIVTLGKADISEQILFEQWLTGKGPKSKDEMTGSSGVL
jgi:hypothetical protein